MAQAGRKLADETPEKKSTLIFRCSNCGFEKREPGQWFTVKNHIRLKAECQAVGAKVLTITLDEDGQEFTREVTNQAEAREIEEAVAVAAIQEESEEGNPFEEGEPFPNRHTIQIRQPTMAERFAGVPPSGPPGSGDEFEDEPEEEYLNVNRVSIGRSAVPELPAWLIATYEAFRASGYAHSLSFFLEEAVALNLIFTGVNVQILPYSVEERRQLLERVGAITKDMVA